jgi:hypothetical protein
MWRALVFLSLVGAAIYGFLVVTHDALSENTKDAVATSSQVSQETGDRLSSWGSYLPRRVASHTSQSEVSSQNGEGVGQTQGGEEVGQTSERSPIVASENEDEDVGKSSENDSVKSGSSIAPSVPAEATTQSGSEPPATKSRVRKSSKRTRSPNHGVVVATADQWNGQWTRRFNGRRGFGLFMFRGRYGE